MALLFLAVLFLVLAPSASAAPKLSFVKVAEAKQPTVVTSPPGYRDLLYVAERTGKIRILRKGKWLSKPLLDLGTRTDPLMIERGLLGLAFPPDFEKSGLFYIYFTARNGDSVVEEHGTQPGRPAKLLPKSTRTVIRIPKVADRGNHNGGHLGFLGKNLYISIGDGFDPGDPPGNAQNLESLRGKILRIDPRPDTVTGLGYRIPAGNPFATTPGRDEIFAYGFRNPHSFTFFKGKDGERMMVISDVGQSRFEELNVLPLASALGGNFGWKSYEGFEPYSCGLLCPNGADPTVKNGVIWPQLVYSHDDGCAIIGGPVVGDPALSSIRGRIVYGDFCANRIRTAEPRNPVIFSDEDTGSYLPPGEGQHSALNGFGTDGYNRLYAFSNFGGIYRIVQRGR